MCPFFFSEELLNDNTRLKMETMACPSCSIGVHVNRVPLYMYVIGKTDFILTKVHNNAKHTKMIPVKNHSSKQTGSTFL